MRTKARSKAKPERLEHMTRLSGYFLYLPIDGEHLQAGKRIYATRKEAEQAAAKHPQKPNVGRLVLRAAFCDKGSGAYFDCRTFAFADNRTQAEWMASDDYKRRKRKG